MAYDGRVSSFSSSIPPTQHAPYASMTQASPPHPQRATQSFGRTNGHYVSNAPQIYTAVYSGVAVYEMEIGSVAVMRRRADSWLNATQILKVAAVEKGKRTKILEKEIHQGQHEKVQGGYGRYQGTWISYERGRQFCRQYGVEEILLPLLEYDLINDGTSNKNTLETPTKEQAMAANRKKLYSGGIERQNQGSFTGGTFFQGISPTASNAIAAMNKAARFDSPVARPGSAAQRKAANLARQNSQQHVDSQGTGVSASQGSAHSFQADMPNDLNGAFYSNSHYAEYQGDMGEPPRKRLRPESSQEMALDPALNEETPTEVNESFIQSQPMDGEAGQMSLPPMLAGSDKSTEEKRQALLNLFEDPARNDATSHPALQQLSGRDLDLPLDTTANTALHWAATLARVPIMKSLIARGANIFQGNAVNQTPLMAAVQVNNSFDCGCFPDMLEILGPLIDVRDATGRTVLHHIAVSSGIKGRAQSSRYYLESLLEFTVRQGSNPNSQHQPSQNASQTQSKKPMNLGRFMSEVVNIQDRSGNTALNLVARIGNRPIINQLEEVGADFDLANATGFKPADFGVFPRTQNQSQSAPGKVDSSSQESLPASQVDQIREEIFATTNSILQQTQAQYQSELTKKTELINQQYTELRNVASEYEQERSRLDVLQQQSKERTDRQQKIANHQRGNTDRRKRLDAKKREVANVPPIEPISLENVELPTNGDDDDAQIKNMHDADVEAKLQLLPSKQELTARINAQKSSNERLRGQLQSLRERSSELEGKYRKVVSLCTHVAEEDVDHLLGALLDAVGVDKDVDDSGRLREFIRKAQDV